MNLRCLFGHKDIESHKGISPIFNLKYNMEQPAVMKVNTCQRCKRMVGFIITDDTEYKKNAEYLIEMKLVSPVKNTPTLSLIKE